MVSTGFSSLMCEKSRPPRKEGSGVARRAGRFQCNSMGRSDVGEIAQVSGFFIKMHRFLPGQDADGDLVRIPQASRRASAAAFRQVSLP